jgi:signal transduction histidine kinase/DNA-binding response OmpR family regulator
MPQVPRTLLVVDDSPEDRELYRRYLRRDPDYSYTIVEATLGQQGLALWFQHQPDVVLLDYRLPDLDGLEFLDRLSAANQSSHLPVIVVTGQGSEAIAVKTMKAGAQDYLVKEQITPESLQWSVNHTIESVQLRIQVQQGIERERIVSQMTLKVHQTLNLDEILQTTVTEVRQYLQTDRVLIFRLQSDGWGTIVTESVGHEWSPLLSTSYYDPCLSRDYLEPFRQGMITSKSDIHDGSIDPCHVELLDNLQVQANLVVPIRQNDQLWGMLIAHHCTVPRQWQTSEIALLKDLTAQVGIALKQAELYQQAQTELAERRRAEAEREQLFERERAAREEAECANRTKDEFLAILSHELRTPLNPILGWTKLLQTRNLDPAKTATALATIERNAKLQTQLIDDLLDVARILQGKFKFETAPVDLVFVIESAIDTVRTAAVAKNILLYPVLSKIGPVAGDATRLQQIVWNLLSNAIKFTPSGGRVEVRLEPVSAREQAGEPRRRRAEEPGSTPVAIVGDQAVSNSPDLQPPVTWAQITITDTGKGIKPDFLPHLFESFRQEDASITRSHSGLGLGLAIVRYLVEAHGGMIWAFSEGEGKGATFTVQLPLLKVAPEPVPLPDETMDQLDLTGLRVIAVDDDPDACNLITTLLTEYGAEVLTLTSATEALETFESFQPDVLVSDIGMPDMDGFMLLQKVRALRPEQGGQIPAIAVTAYAREEDRRNALERGFQDHMAKPLDPEVLASTVWELTRP